MKYLLLALSLVLVSVSAQAQFEDRAPSFYSVKFEIESIKPMCPDTVPGGAVCMAYGQVVTLKAPLKGCLDKVVFTEFTKIKKDGVLTIHAVGVARWDPRNIVVMCIGIPSHRATVTVNDQNIDIELKNSVVGK